jgi:hypothetical protein
LEPAQAMPLLLMALVMGGTPPLDVEPSGHVFTSSEGIEVAVAAVRSTGPKRALVRLSRSGASPVSKVWLAQVREGQELTEYGVKVGKKDHVLLITRMGFPVVYPPELGREVSVHWSDEKSRALDTRQLLDEDLRQETPKK